MPAVLAATPPGRTSAPTPKPVSPEDSTTRRNGSSSRLSTFSAHNAMRSCSATLASGCAIETISTLWNWCWRSMPRVSRPAAPASARKQSVSAVRRIGSCFSATMSPATVLVSGTSAVGISQRPSVVLEQVIGEFRQVGGAIGGGVVHQRRHHGLGVAVPARVQVDHELAKRPLQPRQRAAQHGKARTRQLRGGRRSPSCPAPRPARNAASAGSPDRAARPAVSAPRWRSHPGRPAHRHRGCWAGSPGSP